MLRGLLIRKAFLLVDSILLLLFIWIAYAAFDKLYLSANSVNGFDEEIVIDPVEIHVAKAGGRAEYDSIIDNGLFGAAAKTRIPEAPPAPKLEIDTGDEPPTDRPLKLLGTAFTSPTDPLASAGIRNLQTNIEDAYYMGEPVMDGVTLMEVHKRKVILFDSAKRKRVSLEMEGLPESTMPNSGPSAAGRSPGGARSLPSPARASSNPSGNTVVVSKKEMQEAANDYGSLLTQLKPRMHKDRDGNVVGITSGDLSKFPLAKKLGFQDNDVVTKINNIKIGSEDKLLEIASKFKNSTVFRVDVLRNGQTITRTISIR